MIVRDEYGIIVQQPSMDGGDSAARMGISALENMDDRYKLEEFLRTKERVSSFYTFYLVRHPFQKQWNDPSLTSRDQLIQFLASEGIAIEVIAEDYKDQWFINKDFLDPAVRLYLFKKAQTKAPRWLQILGTFWMHLSMFFNTKIKPNEEMNQFACMCLCFGPKWVRQLYNQHPDIEGNIRGYWNDWRDQSELGEILIRALQKARDL